MFPKASMAGFSWDEDPKRFAFTTARYKFVAKMVEGRIRKFYEDVVLLAQAFVHDPETKVASALAEAEKALSEFS